MHATVGFPALEAAEERLARGMGGILGLVARELLADRLAYESGERLPLGVESAPQLILGLGVESDGDGQSRAPV